MNEEFVEQNQEQVEATGNDIEAIVKEMLENGAEKDEIIVALNKMKEEGKLTDEEVARAVELVEKLTQEEQGQAEQWFGMKFDQ